MAADPSDLTTLDAVKVWTDAKTQAGDTLIQQLITAASAWIVSYLDRPIKAATLTETRQGTGTSSMVMRAYPITAVASVAWNGASITGAADPLTGSSGFLFDGRRIDLIGYCFPYKTPVVVTYSAGYATVPADIAQTCIELVGEALERRRRIGQASKIIQGETITFNMKALNETTRTALDAYRAVAPV